MIKAVIVDDERLARKALQSLLDEIPDLEIIAEFENADDCLEGTS